MQTPRAWIEAYSRSLNDVSDAARTELERRLYALDWTQDVAAIREQVVAIMQPCCGASTTMAARLAADFYDGLRERSGVRDGFKAVIDPCREPEATEGAVRAFAQDLVDGKPLEQFVGKCSDRLDQETRTAANKCVEANARRDPKRPRWARVPTGPETCEFCIMLASRGFVYRSEDVASHAHANCDCRVVPSWDGDKAAIEGYDPDAYYRQWKALETYKAEDRRIRDLMHDDTLARLSEKSKAVSDEMAAIIHEGLTAKTSARYFDLADSHDAIAHQIAETKELRAREMRDIIAMHRSMGPTNGNRPSAYLHTSGLSARLDKEVMDSAEFMPTSWLELMDRMGVRFEPLANTPTNSTRSHYYYGTNTIYLDPDADKFTVVHEMMHAMDEWSIDFNGLNKYFFLGKTNGKTIKPLSELTGDPEYDIMDEQAYDMGDHCIHPYAYKVYGDDSVIRARAYTDFEIGSMGVEWLYRDVSVFERDPDHLRHVLKLLREVQ